MDKSILEKRLENKAERRVKDEIDALKMNSNKILDRLKIKIGEKELPLYMFLNGYDQVKEYSNFKELVEQLKKEYLEDEVNSLLRAVDEFEELKTSLDEIKAEY